LTNKIVTKITVKYGDNLCNNIRAKKRGTQITIINKENKSVVMLFFANYVASNVLVKRCLGIL